MISAGSIQVRKDYRLTLVEANSLRITDVDVTDTGTYFYVVYVLNWDISICTWYSNMLKAADTEKVMCNSHTINCVLKWGKGGLIFEIWFVSLVFPLVFPWYCNVWHNFAKKSYFYYPKKGVEGRFLNEGRRGISPV